jgi:hypothetical protein
VDELDDEPPNAINGLPPPPPPKTKIRMGEESYLKTFGILKALKLRAAKVSLDVCRAFVGKSWGQHIIADAIRDYSFYNL